MKPLEALNHAAFADYLNISERSLRRYRDRIKTDFCLDTTFEGPKNQTLYHPDWFDAYAMLRDGAVLCCAVTCPDVQSEGEVATVETNEAISAKIVVHDGNHRDVLDLTLPQSFDLGALRPDDSVFTVSDPLALAEQALAAMDAVSNAMKQDLQDQQAKLQATQKASEQIGVRASELRLEKLQYEIESRVTARMQNPVTAKLQRGLGVLGNGQRLPDGSSDSTGPSQ